ncbi:MAG: YetF domain-containing protein [Cyanobacteria bacterium P01_H01_bin.162]
MNQIVFFYSGSEPLIRIVFVGSLAYFSLVLLLRISGKRSLAQLNAFDFVVTVAIGSTLGRLITAKGTSLAEGITAFLTLLLLQYLVSWLTVRSSAFADLVTADPSLLYFRGQFLPTAMRAQRVTQSQLLAVVRQHQVVSLSAVEAIVMESAGTIAIIPKAADGTPADAVVLGNVRGVS